MLKSCRQTVVTFIIVSGNNETMTQSRIVCSVPLSKRVWGWYFFDWASQPFHTLLITFIFAPYFVTVAAEYFVSTGVDQQVADAQAQSVWGMCLTICGLIIAFGAPLLGALADSSGRRIPWVFGFSVLYVLGSATLWFTLPDGSNIFWMLVPFGIGFVAAEYALIFVNSQLPSLGSTEEVGDISGSGFAFGYAGGFVSLVILLLFFSEQSDGRTLIGIDPVFGLDASRREGTRAVGPLSAVWFVIFMIPYFLWVRDDLTVRSNAGFRQALWMLGNLIKSLRRQVSLSTYLISSMFYRDALNGLYSFGGIYAALVLNWSITQIGTFGIVALVSAVAFSWLGGKIDQRIGPKPVIIGAIWVLIGVCVIIVSMSRTTLMGLSFDAGSSLSDNIFFVCGILIGGMGGILQAASRSLMVRHTDRESPTEFFGLYGLSGRATAFLAPMLIAAITAATGNVRLGVSPIIGLFILGLILLIWVSPKGDRTA